MIEYNFNTRLDERVYGRVELEDFPVTFDNEFYFTLSPPSVINILEVAEGQPATTIANVYGNKQLFSLNTVNLESLDFNQIPDQDVIILNNLSSIPSTFSLSLSSFYQNGGTLVIIPSADFDRH